jgi:hypothetical protein
MKRIFSRREVMRLSQFGIAGSLFAPLMKEAYAQAAAPKRLVIVVEGNGIYPQNMVSTAARSLINAGRPPANQWTSQLNFHTQYNHNVRLQVANDALGSARALAPLKAQSNGGISLENKAALVLGLSNKIAGGGHSSEHGGLGCCASNVTETLAPTIDSILGSFINSAGIAPYDAIRVGTASPLFLSTSALQYRTCAFGFRKPAPIIVDVNLAYQSVFGPLLQGSSATTAKKRSELLSFAKADANAARQTFPGSSRERAKLDSYVAAIETLERRQAKVAMRTNTMVPPAPTASVNSQFEQLGAQFDLVSAALIGGLTNVAVIASATSVTGFDYAIDPVDYSPGLLAGFTANDITGRHKLQHALYLPDTSSALRLQCDQAIVEQTQNHVRLIANLARQLAATPEITGAGNMLDNTIILFMSDNGEQHHSSGEEWPMLLVGGSGLGLKTNGQTLVYPSFQNTNNRQVSNVFNTLGHAVGMNLNDFGQEGASRIAAGPLGDLL